MKTVKNFVGTTLVIGALIFVGSFFVSTGNNNDDSEDKKLITLSWSANVRVVVEVVVNINGYPDVENTAGRFWEESFDARSGDVITFIVKANKSNLTVCKITLNGRLVAEKPEYEFQRCVLRYEVA